MLPDFAKSLYQAFEREEIPILLAGGWAVCHHGYSRFTNDIDWVCSREREKSAINLMNSLGFEIVFEAMATRFKSTKHLTLCAVDLIWVDEESYAVMAQTATHTGRKRDIPVIGLETLLAMKIHALKNHDDRKGKDLLDIRSILHENPGKVSESRLRELCDRYGDQRAYPLIRSSV